MHNALAIKLMYKKSVAHPSLKHSASSLLDADDEDLLVGEIREQSITDPSELNESNEKIRTETH